MAQGPELIGPCWDELLGDVPGVAGLQDRVHHRGIVDLLSAVELASARNSRRVVVTDEVFVLADAANHVPVHDLDVVDVEQELHAW